MIVRLEWIEGQDKTMQRRGNPDQFNPCRVYGPDWTHTGETFYVCDVLVSY